MYVAKTSLDTILRGGDTYINVFLIKECNSNNLLDQASTSKIEDPYLVIVCAKVDTPTVLPLIHISKIPTTVNARIKSMEKEMLAFMKNKNDTNALLLCFNSIVNLENEIDLPKPEKKKMKPMMRDDVEDFNDPPPIVAVIPPPPPIKIEDQINLLNDNFSKFVKMAIGAIGHNLKDCYTTIPTEDDWLDETRYLRHMNPNFVSAYHNTNQWLIPYSTGRWNLTKVIENPQKSFQLYVCCANLCGQLMRKNSSQNERIFASRYVNADYKNNLNNYLRELRHLAAQ